MKMIKQISFSFIGMLVLIFSSQSNADNKAYYIIKSSSNLQTVSALIQAGINNQFISNGEIVGIYTSGGKTLILASTPGREPQLKNYMSAQLSFEGEPFPVSEYHFSKLFNFGTVLYGFKYAAYARDSYGTTQQESMSTLRGPSVQKIINNLKALKPISTRGNEILFIELAGANSEDILDDLKTLRSSNFVDLDRNFKSAQKTHLLILNSGLPAVALISAGENNGFIPTGQVKALNLAKNASTHLVITQSPPWEVPRTKGYVSSQLRVLVEPMLIDDTKDFEELIAVSANLYVFDYSLPIRDAIGTTQEDENGSLRGRGAQRILEQLESLRIFKIHANKIVFYDSHFGANPKTLNSDLKLLRTSGFISIGEYDLSKLVERNMKTGCHIMFAN